jgi:hypothetical protein
MKTQLSAGALVHETVLWQVALPLAMQGVTVSVGTGALASV